MLRQLDQALVVHNTLNRFEAPLQLRQFHKYRVFGRWRLKQCTATQKSRAGHEQYRGSSSYVPRSAALVRVLEFDAAIL